MNTNLGTPCSLVDKILRLSSLRSQSFLIFFKKWANPGLFFFDFWSFQANNTIFTTNQCEKLSCPSSIQHRDSNPRPLECESPPITTNPGLSISNLFSLLISAQDCKLLSSPPSGFTY